MLVQLPCFILKPLLSSHRKVCRHSTYHSHAHSAIEFILPGIAWFFIQRRRCMVRWSKYMYQDFSKGSRMPPLPPLAANRAKPPPPIHELHVKHKLFEFSLYCAVEWHGELQDYDCNLMPVCILSWMWERNNCQLDEEPNQEQHKMYLLWITSYNGLLCMFFFYMIHV